VNGDEILEHNLTRLFRASWKPVTPSAHFAADLRARLESEVVRSAGASGRRSTRETSTSQRVPSVQRAPSVQREPSVQRATPLRATYTQRVRLAAAFLALVAGLATAWFLLRDSTRAASAEQIVAAGSVAVQDDPDGATWRAATERELERGIDLGPREARVSTPPGREVTVHLGSSGRVDVAPATRVGISAARAEGAREFDLTGSSARMRRDDSGEPWRIVMPGGVVALARGILSWSQGANGPTGATSFVELAAGIAWVATEERAELAIGQRTELRDGRIVVSAVRSPSAAGDLRDGARLPVPSSTPLGERALANLTGAIVLPGSAAAPSSLRLTLLRQVRLPDVSEAETTVFHGTPTFAYEGLQAGTYDVYVEVEGYAVARRAAVEVAADSATDLRFELVLERTLRGRVIDALTQAPISGAVVLAEALVPAQVVPFEVDVEASGWIAATVTGMDGLFTLAGLDAEAARLRVSAPGYAASWVRATGALGAPADTMPIELARGGGVEGRVLRQDGSPWPGAIVIASRMGTGALGERMSYGQARSDTYGAYAIGDLPRGSYVVFSFDPAAGGTPATRDLRISGAEIAHLDLGPTDRRTRLVGTVRDARGVAMPGLDIMIGVHTGSARPDSSWVAARTDAEGRYAFEGVDPREYELYAGRGLGLSFSFVGTVDVPLAPEVQHDFTLAAGGLRGRVSTIDGAPAAGAWIIVTQSAEPDPRFVARAQTDATGAFEVLGLAPGAYTVSAHELTPGVAAVCLLDVEVTLEARAVELRFARGVELRVRVVDSEGRPIEGRRVRFTDEAGVAWQFSAESATDADGVHAVPGLLPGRWRIAVEGADPQVIDLELGAGRDVVFTATSTR